MKLIVKPIEFETGGKPILIMNKQDAEFLGLHSSDRVLIKSKKKKIISIIDISDKLVSPGEAGANIDLCTRLNIALGHSIDVVAAGTPESVRFIKEKIQGRRLNYKKIKAIIEDVVERHLTDVELSAFITSLSIYGMSMDETESLSKAMIQTGKKIKLPGKKLVDKHGIGGCSGDTTSMVLVPTVAAAGLTIAKTSSRAITSPAGTADKMEILAPVEFKIDEIKKIIKKANACLVWGGTLDLAPADDTFVKIEYPLSIDPLMLPSIMSKKKAMGSKYLVIDMPTGRGAKIKTVGAATSLAYDFIELGKRLGIHTACGITYGEQPIGYRIGPALEAQEALLTLKGNGPKDLLEKVASLAGILFEMVAKNHIDGKKHALYLIKSGKAYKKMKQIIEAQGGDPNIKPSDIEVGKKHVYVRSNKSGFVLWTKNAEIAAIAREAGAPKDKGAGLIINKKNGDKVKKGDILLIIYSNNSAKLDSALKLVKEYEPIVVGKSYEERLLLSKVPAKIPHKRIFLLER
ncbi:MAG: AMP phosphorylase [Candidatus Aenigmarchaeota archaeon]|nr:AMP phosphorylase [Candidatus Aenigmarchaeota archaeon]